MLDLYNKKYDRQTLKDNIYNVQLIDILKTQIIDSTFAVRYILNKKYQLHENDKITENMVFIYQPHITYYDLQKIKKQYDTDDDSVDDFDTVANR